LFAELNAVHAGGEPRWKSGHLEPLFLVGANKGTGAFSAKRLENAPVPLLVS